MLKILISAYACEPNKGSEPEVGWKIANTLATLGHKVYVITRSNNKENIENYLKYKKAKNITFLYFDLPKWIIKILRKKNNSYSYLYIFLWHIFIFFYARNIINQVKFNLIHHVTFASLRFPNLLSIYKIPFIFGPVTGGDVVPFHLRKSFPLSDKIKEYLRDLSNKHVKFSLLLNLTLYNSYLIIVNNKETKKLIPKKYHYKVKECLAIGIDKKNSIIKKTKKSNKFFQICYVGNLISIKGLDIVFKTFLKLIKSNHNIRLNIIGKGPLKLKLINEAEKFGINKYINWIGQVNKSKLQFLYKKNDLLIMPSLRDSGGFVILEAMNNGLPVATLNIGGPAKIVDNLCGIKINVKDLTQEQIVNNLSNKISYLIENPMMYKSKVKKSLLKVKNFYWSKKVNFIYENLKINEIK